MKNVEKPKDKQVLQSTFHFDLDDLNANRDGRISEAQKARLWRKTWETLWLSIGVLSLPFIFLYILGSSSFGSSGSSIFLIVIIPLLLSAGTMWWFRDRRKAYEDTAMGQAAFAEGIIQIKVPAGAQNGNNSRLLIDDQAFSVLTKDAVALKNYEPYRIYYAPHTRTILSAEWMREFDNNLIADDAAETDMPAESPPKHKRIN